MRTDGCNLRSVQKLTWSDLELSQLVACVLMPMWGCHCQLGRCPVSSKVFDPIFDTRLQTLSCSSELWNFCLLCLQFLPAVAELQNFVRAWQMDYMAAISSQPNWWIFRNNLFLPPIVINFQIHHLSFLFRGVGDYFFSPSAIESICQPPAPYPWLT